MNRRAEEDDDEERQRLAGSDRPEAAGSDAWPTVDGPLGVSGEESVACARRFFRWGFALLPFLWAVNCFYFWPVLRSRGPSIPSYFHQIRPCARKMTLIKNVQTLPSFISSICQFDVVHSAIGFVIFSVLLTSWALTFMIGGERLFGPAWSNLVMYNVADKLGLTGWT